MLPDKDVGCHRTGFAMSCYDGVTKHRCQLWCHVSGTDAMDQPIDAFGCADVLAIKLIHETSKEVRQSAASMDKVATEVKNAADGAAARDVHMVNGLRATLPLLLNGMEERDVHSLRQTVPPKRIGKHASDVE